MPHQVGHCCSHPRSLLSKNLFPQWLQLSCTNVIHGHCCATVTMTSLSTDAQHVPTMGQQFWLLHNNDPDHASCLIPWKNVTDIPTCSLLVLEHEEHLKCTFIQNIQKSEKQTKNSVWLALKEMSEFYKTQQSKGLLLVRAYCMGHGKRKI